MSKPLLGGGAAAVALLSVSLLFVSQTSVASTLEGDSEGLQQKGIAAEPKAPGADVTPTSDPNAEAAATSKDAAKPNEPLAESAKPVTAATATANPEAESPGYEATPAQVFTATAYSLRGRTASGKLVTRGLIAADRRVLPLGTRVRIEAGPYSGEYLVADTGGAVRGRKIDIWVPNTGEAMRFGRRPIKLTVLRHTRPRTSAPRTR
jgi:3D (Asp-Asp-Asp) domain-containing protein